MEQPKLLNTYDLLSNNLFKIPKYQRPYSWTKTELKDLFSDIEDVFIKEREHFMATIVTVKLDIEKDQGKPFDRLEVVDGQQRLTSICILLKTISIALKNKKSNGIRNTIEEILIKNKNNKLIIIDINYDTQSIFSNYMRQGKEPDQNFKAKTITEQRLIDAINLSKQFVNTFLKSKDDLDKLYEVIAFRLNYLLHIQNDIRSVYTTFEVLNSRGRAVDTLDKCKSILMGKVSELPNAEENLLEINRYWEEIFSEIGTIKINTDEIVRMAATILDQTYTRDIVSSENALKFFKEIEADFDLINEWHNTLVNITKKMSALAKDTKLKAILKIIQVKFLFVTIHLRNLKDSDRNIILKELENVSFRTYGLEGLDSRNERGNYIELAQRIIEKTPHSNPLTPAQIKSEVKKLGKNYDIYSVVNKLCGKDLYDSTNWHEELRYFFYKYEEFLSKYKKCKINDKLWKSIWDNTAESTIEHIMPQKAQKYTAWSGTTEEFNDEDELNSYINRLGNFVILTQEANRNSGTKSFKEKKEIYKNESYLLCIEEIVNGNTVWNKKKIEERENSLLEAAKVIWADVY